MHTSMLREVDVAALAPGMTFDRPLVDAAGHILLSADTALTHDMCEWLLRLRAPTYASSAPEVTPDVALHQTIAADAEEAHTTELRRTKLRKLELDRALNRERHLLRASAEQIVAERSPRWSRLPLRIETDPDAAINPQRLGAATRLSDDDRNQREQLLARLIARVLDGSQIDSGVVSDLADELVDEHARRSVSVHELLASARDPFARSQNPDADLASHMYAIAGLCAAMAVRLHFSHSDIRAAALVGMLGDIGMCLIPRRIRAAARPLTDEELNLVRRHPGYSVAIIERMTTHDDARTLPEIVQFAVWQHHERDNAAGYPSRLKAQRLHDLARLAAVADMFLGLVEPRPHRPGIDPKTALRHVLRAQTEGQLAPWAVRALADLFTSTSSTHRAEVRVHAQSPLATAA